MTPQFQVDDDTGTPYGNILCGHFVMNDTYVLRRPKARGDWLMVYTLGGEGYFCTPEGRKETRAGQVTLLREGVPHEYGTVQGKHWDFVWVHFHKLLEMSYLPQEEVLVVPISDEYSQQRVMSALDHIVYLTRDRSDYWYALCENSVREIVLLIAQQLQTRRDPRIVSVLQRLSQSMQEEIKVGDLARAVGLSSSRLSHLFKQEVGEGIIEYVNRMRIKQAALFMEHMGRSATEASLDVGFNNYNHFASLFRKQIGVSPRAYRQEKGMR